MTLEQNPGEAIKEYQTIVSQFLTAHDHFFKLNETSIAILCGEAISTTCLSAIFNPIFKDIPDTLLLLRNYIQQTCMRTKTAFRANEQLPWPQLQGFPQEVAQ
jgi:hypothetical protein